MRGVNKISLLAAVFAAALAIAGCGSGDEGTIPSDQSDTLLSLLSSVQNSVETGDCELAQKTAEELVDTVNGLPADVDNEVQGALTRASEQLVNLAQNPEECVDENASGPEGVETTDTTDTTATESTTTLEETTTPDESTTTEEEQPPAPEEDSEPASPGGGNGGQPGGATPSGGLEPPDGGG